MPDGTQVTTEVGATAATEAEAPRPVMPSVTVLRSADAREVMGKSVPYPKRLTKTILRNRDCELYLRELRSGLSLFSVASAAIRYRYPAACARTLD